MAKPYNITQPDDMLCIRCKTDGRTRAQTADCPECIELREAATWIMKQYHDNDENPWR